MSLLGYPKVNTILALAKIKGHGLNIQNSKWVPLIDHNNSYPKTKIISVIQGGASFDCQALKMSAEYMVKMGDEFDFQIVSKKRWIWLIRKEPEVLIF